MGIFILPVFSQHLRFQAHILSGADVHEKRIVHAGARGLQQAYHHEFFSEDQIMVAHQIFVLKAASGDHLIGRDPVLCRVVQIGL